MFYNNCALIEDLDNLRFHGPFNTVKVMLTYSHYSWAQTFYVVNQ